MDRALNTLNRSGMFSMSFPTLSRKLAALVEYRRKRSVYRATMRMLENMTPRELADINIGSAMFHEIASQAAGL